MRKAQKCLIIGLALTALGFATVTDTARADDYNQRPFLGPGENSKIQRVITHGRTERLRQETATGSIANNPNQSIVNTGCGELAVGNVRTTGRPGERTPRENIVIAREIINAPINCGTRARR